MTDDGAGLAPAIHGSGPSPGRISEVPPSAISHPPASLAGALTSARSPFKDGSDPPSREPDSPRCAARLGPARARLAVLAHARLCPGHATGAGLPRPRPRGGFGLLAARGRL